MGNTRDGGKPVVKPLPYSPPTGIKNQTTGPGLGQDNLGSAGTQGRHSGGSSSSGRPGIGGENCGNMGSQRC